MHDSSLISPSSGWSLASPAGISAFLAYISHRCEGKFRLLLWFGIEGHPASNNNLVILTAWRAHLSSQDLCLVFGGPALDPQLWTHSDLLESRRLSNNALSDLSPTYPSLKRSRLLELIDCSECMIPKHLLGGTTWPIPSISSWILNGFWAQLHIDAIWEGICITYLDVFLEGCGRRLGQVSVPI